MSTQKNKKDLYKVTLALRDGEVFKGEGGTLLEAMSEIEAKELIKTLGTIIVTYKDKKIERVCNALRLQKIFGIASKKINKDTARIIYSKFLLSGLI